MGQRKLHSIVIGALGALIFSTAALAGHDHAATRAVSVNGEGEAVARPDRARLNLGAEALDPDLKRAEADVNRIVRDFVAQAKKLGAKDEQISATGVSISPEYVWPEGGRERKFTGYRVSRQVELRIDALDKLGDYLLKATSAGFTSVSPPMLESSKAPELQRQALVHAANDARGKAKLLAETLGAKLGVVMRVTESSVGIPMPMMEMKQMRMASAPADGNAEMGLSFGEIRVRATVSAEFDLLQ